MRFGELWGNFFFLLVGVAKVIIRDLKWIVNMKRHIGKANRVIYVISGEFIGPSANRKRVKRKIRRNHTREYRLDLVGNPRKPK